MNQNKKGGRESRFFKDLKKKHYFYLFSKSDFFVPGAPLCTPYCVIKIINLLYQK